MKQNVTETSIEAYYTLDHNTTKYKVAAEIIRLTEKGERAWIGKVAKNIGMEKSSVSGRLNELKKEPFVLDGRTYRLVFSGKQKDYQAGRITTVETWAAVLSNPVGQQAKMF